MKKTLIILLLIGSTSSFAQTYFPFPDSVAVWKQTSVYDQVNTVGFTHYNIFMDGDTIIDSASYKKLYTYSCGQFIIPSSYPIPIFNCPIDTLNSLYYGALREVNKRVYFLPDSLYNYNHFYPFCFTSNWNGQPSLNEELLLYDFNVAVGDTLIYPFLDSLKMVITSIDSTLIQSVYRKKYNYNLIFNWGMPCAPFGVGYNYVEGIGDINSGLFSLFIMFFENGEFLNCFEDNQVSFSNNDNGGCITTSLNELVDENNLKIYPNPATNQLFFELDYQAQIKVSMYNISGKEVYSSFINKTKSIIDVSSFKSGLYLVKFIDEKGTTKSQLVSIY